ncbi:glycerophosphodiester phosphodiesterase [Lacticaseibacillus sp. N501-2]|uniref:glycerophosphodiester phosphodiesterase n=1 Tax=Lacticaseibacillus salsurae TaxID=3367729 RepID=UPI0038B387C8
MSKTLRLSLLLAFWACLSAFVVVGHRGDPLAYPEETFQSDSAAFAAGADYVELDVQVAKDGTLVIQHDPTLLRTTGSDVTIASSNYSQIQQYHTKNGEPIHSLQALFTHYQQSNVKFLIETKIEKGVPHPQMEQRIAALVKQYHMQDRVMFHSFSLSSLKRLQVLLPNVPRIFIVGSLKRITFAVFPYVTGINISSTLVTAKLVSDLHHIGQKVYVWDEMNENAAKWRWLSNIPIDGVVTNYPALAHQYQLLTKDAQSHPLDALATNNSTKALPVYENPYMPNLRKQTIAPGKTFTVIRAIRSQGVTYDQIDTNAFVPANTLNLAPMAGWAQLLVNQHATVCAKTTWQVPTRATANAQSAQSGTLTAGSTVTITAVKLHREQVWCQTQAGWVKASHLKLHLHLTDARLWLRQFNTVTTLTRPQLSLGQTSIDTLDFQALGLSV